MSTRFLSFTRLLGLSALLMGLSIGCGGSNTPPIEVPRPDAARSTVEVSRAQGVVANGQDASAITVTVRSTSGEPMGGQQVRLEVSGEAATAAPVQGVTDAGGVWKSALTATQPGVKKVKVSVLVSGGAVVLGTQPTVTFDALAATKLAFATTALSATAGAPVAPALEVSIQDAQGHVVAGATNEVTLTLGAHPEGAALEGTVTAKAIDGVAHFSEVVLGRAGTGYTLVASAEGLASATSAAFDVAPARVATLTLAASAQSVTAGEPVGLSVTLSDALGNVATNYVGTVVLSSTDATAELPVAEYTFTATDAGQHTFSGLVFKRAGTAHITVADKALGALLQATTDVGVLPGAAAKLAFTQQPASQSVRQPLGTVQVTLTDAFDNTVAVNAPAVTVALLGGSGAALGGVTTVAPVDGVASFTTLSVDAEGAGYKLTASAQGLAGATSAAFDVLDDAAPAVAVLQQGATTRTSIAIGWDAVGDDGVQGQAAAYELRYASSNIVTDADFAAATLVATSAPRAAGARESVTLSGLTVGSTYYVALKVTDDAGNSSRSATLTVSTQDALVAKLAFTQQPVDGVAGVALAEIRVALQEADGAVVASATSAVTLTLKGDASVTKTVSAVNGVATFSGLVIQKAGENNAFEATSGSLAPVSSGPFTVAPASAKSLVMVGLVAPVIANKVGTVQVTALDAFGNVATGYAGTVHFSSSDSEAALPADTSFSAADSGKRTFSVTFKSRGHQSVTVTDTAAGTLTDELTVDVGSGSADRLVVSGLPASVTAGVAQRITVTARDSFGNIVTGYTGTVAFASQSSGAELPANTAFTASDAGQKSFDVTFKAVGEATLTVTDTAVAALTASVSTTVEPGEARALLLSAPASVTAGGAFSVTLTVEDAFGNRATGYTGTVHFDVTGDSGATLPADFTFTAAAAGRHVFDGVLLTRAGDRILTVADTAQAALTDSAEVAVNASAATKLAFLDAPQSTRVRSTLSAVQVALQDAFGNATQASSPAVVLSLGGGSASATLGGTTTRSPVDGVATFSNLSVDAEGNGYTLRASAGTLTGATSGAFDIIDDVAPGKPVLAAGAVTPKSIVIEWNAVGDDGVQGQATAYELRYATSNIITDADFAAATQATTGAPQTPGTREAVSLTGLSTSTTYYVALKVTDNAGNAVRSDTLQVSTQDPQVAGLVFTWQPANGVAGAALANIRVALVDEDGLVVTRSTSAVTLTLSADAAITSTQAAVAGVATFSGLVIHRAGSGYTFQATSGALSTVTSDAFSISPAAVAKLSVTRASQTGEATAGVSTDFTVTALDAFDNVATGYTGTVHFTSTDARAHLPADHTFASADEGQRTFSVTFETAGTWQVNLSDLGNAALDTSVSYSVSAGAAAGFAMTAPDTATAGSAFPVRITALDAFGNVATGYTGTVRLSSTDAAVPAVEHTFAAAEQGVHTFTVALETAGARELQAQDTVDAALVATHALTVDPANAAQLVLIGGAGPYDARTAFPLEVVAQDAFGNVATGYTGTVHFSSSDTDASLPADYTFTAGDQGRHTVAGFVFNTGGTQSIQAVDLVVASVVGAFSAEVIARPTEATSFVLNTPAGPYTAGQTVSLEVVAYTEDLDVATAYTGTVHFSSTDASAVLPADQTFTAGDAGRRSFNVVFTTAGTVTLTVTDTVNAALTQSFSEQVQAGAPAKLAFNTEPANGTVRSTLATVRVALLDAYGNATTATTPAVNLTLKGGSASAVLSGATTVTPVDGEATFSTLSVDGEGTGYQLTAAAAGLSSQDSAPFTIVDDLAPSAPVLTASAATTSVTLTWTAVGDDANLGLAAAYELRYATSPITDDATFSAATPVPTSAPQAAGSAESYTVGGLAANTPYHFALKVRDAANNASPLTTASATTQDPCDGVTCTPQPASCSADRRGVVTYDSFCDVFDNSGICRERSATVACSTQQVCANAACVPVTSAPQAGRVIVSEFRTLGSEFVEIRNTTASALDVRGFILENKAWQRATLRAATDPNDSTGTPVVVPAGQALYGVANPQGAVPAGVGFVYGAPGTDFALDDTGDLLVLSDASGNVEDRVDFGAFTTNPNTPLTATRFVGLAGSSTQLDPSRLTATANDTATNWCVSHYPASGTKQKVTDTAGAANGSCGAVVINEAFIDPNGADDAVSFIELAGPGGALVGGMMLTDVEGIGGTAGKLNADGDLATGETDGVFVIPAGTRIPADGILLIADATTAGTTVVPNFVAGVDVLARDIDMENSGGDSIQLISADGTTLLDALASNTTTAPLATNIASYTVPSITVGLGMVEGTVAIYPPSSSTLARNTASLDTNNNNTDFHFDPTPTPGLPNDTVSMAVTGISPNTTLASATVTTSSVVITGTDFVLGMTVKFGTLTATCSYANATTLNCGTVPANATVGRVDVVLTNPASAGSTVLTVPSSFTYTGVLNGSSNPAQADYCILQYPPMATVTRGQQTETLYGRIYEGGLTDANPGPMAGLKAEVGYGPLSSNPTTATTWRYFPTTFNVKVGNDFEFAGTLTAPTVVATTHYAYAYRFSLDDGLNWTYCDNNGAGSNLGPTSFDPAQLGDMTVNP